MEDAQYTTERAIETLAKLLPRGELPRVPRHPAQRDFVLALLCTRMQRRVAHNAEELRGVLEAGLNAFRCPDDHVTVRRLLIDLGFVKRDRAGLRYVLNYPKVEALLDASVRAQGFELVAAEVSAADARAAARRRSARQR